MNKMQGLLPSYWKLMEASSSLLSSSSFPPPSTTSTKIYRLDIFHPANIDRPIKESCAEFVLSTLRVLSLSAEVPELEIKKKEDDSTSTLVTRLSYLWRQGRTGEAHLCLDSLLARRHQESDWLTSRLMVVRGILLKQDNKILPSLPCFHSAIAFKPSCSAAYWALAEAFSLLGKRREEGEVYSALESLLRGDVATKEKKDCFFETVLDLLLPGRSPSLPSVMVALARFLAEEGHFEKAADKFLEVLVFDYEVEGGGLGADEEVDVCQEAVLALLRAGRGEDALAVVQHHAAQQERYISQI